MFKYFKHKGFTIEYITYGEGNNPVLAFHGFNRPLSDMALFLPILKENEYLISIHLFDHGNSSWPKDLNIEKGISLELFQELVLAFTKELNISSYSLIGYSLGGKVALTLYQLQAQKIPKLLLLAPDGLYINPIYKVVSGTSAGRSMYRKLAKNPRPILAITNLLNNLKLIHPKLHRFVHVHMGTGRQESDRWRIYHTWLLFKHFRPNLELIISLSKRHSGNLNVILGTNDSVIKPKYGKKLLKYGLHENNLHFVNQGHQLLTKETIDYIITQGLWQKS